MGRSRTEEERLDRLAGDGERGGGLPLPLLFAAILEELLDNGSATTARLAEVAAGKLAFKAQYVMEAWGSFDALTEAVLQQMAARRFIASSGGAPWRPCFEAGREVVIIPKRKGKNRAIGVTVYPREERERRSRAEEKSMTVTEYAQRLRDRGLRAVSAERVKEIRASVADFGDHRDAFPVLLDQHGNLLDGRHRRAVDPSWPFRKHQVNSDEDMLQVALVANQSAAWSRDDWKGLAHLVRAVGGQRGRRERVRDALLEDASRSNRQIAELVGCDDKTVAPARAELEIAEFPQFRIHRYEFTAGRGQRPGKHSAACWCGEGDAEPKPEKQQRKISDEQIEEIIADDLPWPEIASRYEVGQSAAQAAKTRAMERKKSRAPQAPPFTTGAEAVRQAGEDDPVPGEFYAGPPMPTPAPSAHTHEWQPVHMFRCSCGALVEAPPA
jgi:hypothetical protein